MVFSEYLSAVARVTVIESLSCAADGSSAVSVAGNSDFSEASAVSSVEVSASASRYLEKPPVYSGIRSISPFSRAGT